MEGAPYKPLTKGKILLEAEITMVVLRQDILEEVQSTNIELLTFIEKKNVPGTVERIEYDPNRTAHIALISYKDNEKAYIISPQGLKQGDIIESGKNVEIKIGNSLELKDIPPGTSIHNVELIPGNGAKLARSAGSSVTLSGYDGDYAILKLASGETRKVSSSCIATIGTVSNPDQKNIKIGKG